ncbi:uncharacterized protein LOC135094708 [Scylla paramamosain]|uniref:uncharacterized protein LOC135094708 n=1 Tax=Scylla paramamosain TaxID=85552 RepID=UPI003082A7D2
MPPTIMRCKVLIALIVWACISLVFVVWPAPSAPPFPLPVTSPHPHAAQHKHQLAQGLPLQAPKSPRRWEVRSKGDGEDGNVFYSERRDFNENDKILAYDGEEMGGRMNGDAGDASERNGNDKKGYMKGKMMNSNKKSEEKHIKGGNMVINKSRNREKSKMNHNDNNNDDDDNYDFMSLMVDTGGQYNVTPPNARLLVYNRIPKCASSTMQTVLRWEGAKRQPVYINVVREPAERFISSFYYVRSKERLARLSAKGHLRARPSSYWLNRTVEQCVMNRDAECSFLNGTKQETVITYFCGHHEACKMVGSSEALQRAKQVVAQRYSVVGLVGHMEMSLQLMETLIPGFLKGALDFYYNIKKKKEKVNKNSHKPAVPREVQQELRRRMGHDVDFYNFLRQRLFLQAQTFLSK